MKKINTRMGLFLLLLNMSLTGCSVLASNGLDYSSYPIPKISQPPPPPPPVVQTPPCQMEDGGQALSLAGCKPGDVVVLRGVNFEFDKAVLTANAKTLLDQVVSALKMRVDIKVEIDGHTDSMGSDEYNQKLSESRAGSVKEYLVAGGIEAPRLEAKGMGEALPIADNGSDEGRELNRRVEMKVVEAAPPALPAAPVAAVPAPGVDHNAVVVLEPMSAFLQEPGAGIPTSIGVVSTVPKPIEAGPVAVTSKRALPPNFKSSQPAIVGYPGSSFVGSPVPAPIPPADAMTPPAATPAAEPASTPIAASGSTVTIENFMFTPETLIVQAGTTVIWNNQDSVSHIVKFPDQASPAFAQGGSFSRSFPQSGEYTYSCGKHPSMSGKIIVQ